MTCINCQTKKHIYNMGCLGCIARETLIIHKKLRKEFMSECSKKYGFLLIDIEDAVLKLFKNEKAE